jgi:hypothetical protein
MSRAEYLQGEQSPDDQSTCLRFAICGLREANDWLFQVKYELNVLLFLAGFYLM